MGMTELLDLFDERILIEGLSELPAAMGQGGTQSKQYFLTLCLALVATTDVWAQNGDPTYTQAIFTSGLEPFSVVIDFDPQDTTNPFKFPDYFTHQWNSVTNKYTVRMFQGINRDGHTSATSDDVNILQYKVSCTETQGSSLVVYRILKIQILDVNDNAPYFINAPYTVRVNEYNFNGTQFFYLPSDQEGILSLSSPLDFESMYRLTGNTSETFFNITVIARDNAQPASTQRSSLTTLRVIITDGDDQGPEFVYPSCIQSSQPNSKSCVRPRYLTSISSGNASVTTPAGYESFFTVRSSLYQGKQYKCEIVKVSGKVINRTNVSQLEIIVEDTDQEIVRSACSHGTRWDSVEAVLLYPLSSITCTSDATIIITFPENDSPTLPLNDPAYTQAIFTSGIEPFSVVIDPDPQDTTNQLKFPDYFTHQWNSVTNKYTVRMKQGINRDGNSSSTVDDVNILQYKISCTEIQGSSSIVYRILKIQITDVNDNSPYFINAPYTVRVNELTPVGVTVFRGILADDLDEGPNKQITYILTPGFSQFNFNGTQYFYLPSDQEGILAVLSSLDFENLYRQTGDINQTFYNITVIARDNAQPASTQRSSLTTLRVIITDGDDQGPEFVYPSCIQSSQPNSKSCIRPKYLTSVYSGNSSEINLDLKPDPSDSSNPTVYMLMQDRDTLNSTVTCTIRQKK
ncbi:Cadherin-99C [Bulinus truncatus]|nr:Cadherin-99C [Bulinus truncatus]